MKQIEYKSETHKGWVNITINLKEFMDYFKKSSPEWYVKRGNKNEVKGRIDKFSKFIDKVNKDVRTAEFYFLIHGKTFQPKLIIVNGRHRLAWLLENGYESTLISIPSNQTELFCKFITT